MTVNHYFVIVLKNGRGIAFFNSCVLPSRPGLPCRDVYFASDERDAAWFLTEDDALQMRAELRRPDVEVVRVVR